MEGEAGCNGATPKAAAEGNKRRRRIVEKEFTMVDMIPRNLSAALATAMTDNVGAFKTTFSTSDECPLLTVLLARKEFHLVLELCTYSDLYVLLVVGKQAKLPYLRHLCRTKLVRLVEALIHAAIWNRLKDLQALLVRYQVPPTVVAGSLWYGSLTPLAGAAMRLSIIGQTDGQRLIRDLTPACADIATETQDGDLDRLSGTAFLPDIASMRHETQYSRIFRT